MLGKVGTSKYYISSGEILLSCQNIPGEAIAIRVLVICRFAKREIVSSGTVLSLDLDPGCSPSTSLRRFLFFSNSHSLSFLKI